MQPVAVSPYVEAYAQGSWTIVVQGTYTDTVNRDYLIYVSLGSTTVKSRFDWSDDNGVTWGGSDIEIDAWNSYQLSYGLWVTWVPGTYSPPLVTGDRFRFHIERPYRPALALNYCRDDSLRSGALNTNDVWTVTFPFATATTPQALVLFDHNIPQASVIRLQASTTSNFAATPFNQVVPWTTSKIRYRIPEGTTYAYWRLHITASTTLTYIEIGKLYLGGELTWTREFDIHFEKVDELFGGSDASTLARGQGRYGLTPKRWMMTFSRRTPANDLATFDTLLSLTRPGTGSARGSYRPFYLYWDSVTGLEIFELLHVEGSVRQAHEYLDAMSPQLSLLQVVKTS
jgi:hypothetical protein